MSFSLRLKLPWDSLEKFNKLRFRMRQDGIKPSPLGEPVMKLVTPAGRYNSCLPSQHRPSHLFPTIILGLWARAAGPTQDNWGKLWGPGTEMGWVSGQLGFRR